MSYLDVVAAAAERASVPVVAYQVSGEYSMIHAAASNGWIDLRAAALESLTSSRRAGAQVVLTYFALDVTEWTA
jgi:porphobilinogen synthase